MAVGAAKASATLISIHALLAESDNYIYNVSIGNVISIHALLAESDLGYKIMEVV